MDDPQLLLQQLVAQVQALYDSTPGSAPQREADKWLTGLVGLEGAWPVLLRVVGPAAGSGQASPFDVRLTFIAAKIMQVRFVWWWCVEAFVLCGSRRRSIRAYIRPTPPP